jgi:muramoyltetrapeptide carboxypeptidase
MTMNKGRALRPGDLIGLLSVSNPVTDEERQCSVDVVEALGFRTVCGESLFHRRGYLAGPDEIRARDVNRMFADPDIAGIFCVRGGEGANRLPEMIDLEVVRKNPKVFLGYSDVTVFHLLLGQGADLVTIHGPMPYTEFRRDTFEGYVKEHFLKAVTETEPVGEILPPQGDPAIQALVPGTVEAPLVGGCLSLISALMGTPWEIDTRGKILIIEDVGEQPYKYDRWLCQLRSSGKLQQCAGVVVGQCIDCTADKPKMDIPLEEIFADLLVPLGVPVLLNVPFGHGKRKATFPLGVRALLDGNAGRFFLTESGVR